MKCKNCNTEIKDDAKFCSNCGFKTDVRNLCPNCGMEIEQGIKFCGSCGAQINDQISGSFSTNHQQSKLSSGSTKQRVYVNKASQLSKASEIVKALLLNENLEYQEFPDSNGILIQAKKPPKIWKTALALEIAATTNLNKDGDDLIVNIGGGKWLDKAAGGVVFWFVFWPAILTTGWGIYIQQQLFKKIDNALIANLN